MSFKASSWGIENLNNTVAARGSFLDPTSSDEDLIYRKSTLVTSLNIGFIGDSISTDAYNVPADVIANLSVNGLTISKTNEAIGGTSTADWLPAGSNYLTAVAAFSSASVRVVSINLGANDTTVAIRHSVTTYLTNMTSITNDLVSRGYVVALNCPTYTVPGSSSGGNDVTSNNLKIGYALVLQQLANGFNVVVGDMEAYNYFNNNPGQLSDGVHPGSAGQTALAQMWTNALTPVVAFFSQETTLQRLQIGSNLSITSGVLNAAASGGSVLELTDGTTDLTNVTKITVSGAVVGGSSSAATLTVSGGGGNYTLITDTLLSSTASSFVFSSIPGSYKYLELQFSVRSSNAVSVEEIYITLNGDSGSNYSWQNVYFTTSATASQSSSDTKIVLFGTTGASSSSDEFSGGNIKLADYASTTKHKTLTEVAGMTGYSFVGSGRWASNSAITSITIVPQTGGTWAVGSRVTLYGIS